MGNASSTPPPLVAVNASAGHVLVPRGTEMYSGSPLAFSKRWDSVHSHPLHSYPLHSHPLHSHPLHSHPLHSRPRTKCKADRRREGLQGGPVYSRVSPRAGHIRRPSLAEPEIQDPDDEEGSESTQLGEVHGRREEGAVKGARKCGVKRGGVSGVYEHDGRAGGGLSGYEGLRDGLGYGGCETAQVEVPHCASRESMPVHNTSLYARAVLPPRPPVLSTSSSLPGPDAGSKQVPPAVRAPIDQTVQRSAGRAGRLGDLVTRSKTSPAPFTNDKNSDWGETINTCICTKICRCRKGEQATKWYEGTAKIGDEVVPVRAKLNARYVLKNDIGKDCGDYTACRKSTSTESNSSGSEAWKSKKHSKNDRKGSKRDDKMEKLEARIDEMMNTAASKQGASYGPSPLAVYGPGFDTSDMDSLDSGMMQRLRMLDLSRTPYHTARMGGMSAAGPQQGMADSMTTRNRQRPRMPPKPRMRMRYGDDGLLTKYEDIGPASPGNPHARLSGMRRKGGNRALKARARFGPLGDSLLDSDSDSTAPHCKRLDMSRRQPLGGRSRPYFDLDDTDVSLAPSRQAGVKGYGNEEDGAPAMDNLPKRRSDDRELCAASPPNRRSQVSPPGRVGGVGSRRTTGKQAHVETDDDEDY